MTEEALLIAIDVGGTSIKSALVTKRLDVVELCRVSTPRSGAADVIDAISEVAGKAVLRAEELSGRRPAAVGVACMGLVDEARGVAAYSSAVGWRDVPLAELLQEGLGIGVAIGHDIRAAARAEAEHGGEGVDSLLFVAIGTGIGGAFYTRSQTLFGARGRAGELGHVQVYGSGRTCGCGAIGCLEAYASASAIGADASSALGRTVTARDVAAAVLRDEDWACRIWNDAVNLLAAALSNAALVLDPELIIVGGGLSLAGSTLTAPLQSALAARYPFADPPPVRAARLGADSALFGAALLARDIAPLCGELS